MSFNDVCRIFTNTYVLPVVVPLQLPLVVVLPVQQWQLFVKN